MTRKIHLTNRSSMSCFVSLFTVTFWVARVKETFRNFRQCSRERVFRSKWFHDLGPFLEGFEKFSDPESHKFTV